MNNFYENIIDKIKKLINDQKYIEANKIIDKELSMPFILKIYEKKILELKEKIKIKLSKQNQNDYYFSSQKIIHYLLSNNFNKQKIAINSIKNVNLKNYLYEIKLFFQKNSFIELKALFFEELINQKIDLRIKINNNYFNPINSLNIYKKSFFKKYFKLLDQRFNKAIVMKKTAFDILNRYVIKNYFKKNIFNQKILNCLINCTKSLFDESFILSHECQLFKENIFK